SRSEYVGGKATSSKFPRLACRFIVVTYDATVAKGVLQQTNFTSTKRQGEAITTLHWAWQWRLALPKGESAFVVSRR
ncbi:MAG: hypothetical protein ACO32I_08535, partial [Candidatus Limnocylindrus sp.]